ncbi:unnamed protein product [Schistocephalus solidus]|uniref:YTH domain-containing protein n=1 Tax=Schistocephalus solidus TaxID=70667 RepID=A0A183T0M7_SCHSO|nr:unnamed protein product [Schistocephalus solidus]
MAGGENERAKILQTELEYLKVKKLKQKKEPKELQQIAKKALKKAVKGKPVKALFVFFPENFKLKISGNKKLKSTGAKWSDVKKVLKSQPADKSIVLIYSGEAIVPFYVVSMRFKTEEGFEETIKRVSTLLAAENGKQPAETKKEDNETVAPLITTEIHASGKDIDTTILQEQGVQSTSDSSTVSADDLRQGQRSTSTSSSSTSAASPTTAQFTSTGKKKPPIKQIDLSQVKKIQRSSLNGKVIVAALSDDQKTPYRLVSLRFKSADAFEMGIKALIPETSSAHSTFPSNVQKRHSNRERSPISNANEQSRPVSRQTNPGRSSQNRYETTSGNGKETPERAIVVTISSTTHSPLSLPQRGNTIGEYYRRSESTMSSHSEDYAKWRSGLNMIHTKTTYTSTDFIFKPSIELPPEEMCPSLPRNYVVTYVASHPTPCPQLVYTPDFLLASTPDVPLSLSEQSHAEQSPMGNGFDVGSHGNQYTDMQDVQHRQKKCQFISDTKGSHPRWPAECCGSRWQLDDLSNHFGDADYKKGRWRQIPLERASCLSIRAPCATSTNSSNNTPDDPRGACQIIYPSRTPATSIRRSRSHSGRPSVHRIELVDQDEVHESDDGTNNTCNSKGHKNCKSPRRRWIKQPISSSCSTCGSSVWQFRSGSGSYVSDSISMDSYEYMEGDCPRGILKLYYRPIQSAH